MVKDKYSGICISEFRRAPSLRSKPFRRAGTKTLHCPCPLHWAENPPSGWALFFPRSAFHSKNRRASSKSKKQIQHHYRDPQPLRGEAYRRPDSLLPWRWALGKRHKGSVFCSSTKRGNQRIYRGRMVGKDWIFLTAFLLKPHFQSKNVAVSGMIFLLKVGLSLHLQRDENTPLSPVLGALLPKLFPKYLP